MNGEERAVARVILASDDILSSLSSMARRVLPYVSPVVSGLAPLLPKPMQQYALAIAQAADQVSSRSNT